jgi:hypothetical protein
MFNALGSRKEWAVLVVVALLALPLFTPRLYGADEVKYLTVLRSVYFDGDVNYGNDYQLFLAANPTNFAWLHTVADEPTSTGHYLNDAPIGAAVLWAPFYVVADMGVLLARSFGSDVERSGISQPYIWAISVGSLLWGLFGLALIYRSCRIYFGVWASRLAVLSVWFASGLVFYLYITPPMAHANSVFAVALFTWLWLRGRERERSLGEWVALGASAGLMVLVRELNWLMMIPLLFDEGLKLLAALRGGTLREWSARVPAYLGYGAVVAVVVAPQFLVYQTLHGSFSPTPFVVAKFSYPQFVLPVLFSGFHGLYSWAPITLLATVGLWFLARRAPVVATGLALAFVAQVLVVGSYATWWGGAAFGARRFLNCTPLFALGLAALYASAPASRRKMWLAVVTLLIAWNFGLAIQYGTGMIPREDPVTMRTIVVNQFTEVPRRTLGVAWLFLTDRWALVKYAPGRDS